MPLRSQLTARSFTERVVGLLFHVSYFSLYIIITYMTNKYMFVDAAPILPTASWDPPNFTLDLSGVAAIVGGDEAVAATIAAYTTGNSWFVGGYPTPGAYVVAKFFGRTLHGSWWNGVFPGDRTDLATAFRLHGPSKFHYYGIKSGSQLPPFSNIPDCLINEKLLQKIKDNEELVAKGQPSNIDLKEFKGRIHNITKKGERGTDCLMYIFTAENGWQNGDEVNVTPNRIHMIVGLCASLLNAGICVVLALMNDWFAFSIIILGMLVNFLFMGTVSSCKITVKKHNIKEPKTIPPGHGIFSHKDNNVIMAIFGDEISVNSITKTRLEVGPKRKSSNFKLGICCITMYMLFLAQLIIPAQASLMGQIFFLASLLIGWFSNAYYSSLDATKAQRQIVKENCGAKAVAVLRGNRTSVFLTLAILARMEDVCLRGVYPPLLGDSDAWKSAMTCIADSVTSKRLIVSKEVMNSHVGIDLQNAWKTAHELKEMNHITEFLRKLAQTNANNRAALDQGNLAGLDQSNYIELDQNTPPELNQTNPPESSQENRTDSPAASAA
ncbi:hypothetical protein K450DRAFT_226287 [Umbelopsis ramanniana AG]|uniref:Uncharacterized protein n=1 Tax=Umbelopsis ramanniana AG TaxID=1314678 RepID=A0AAD5EEY3_UMBRA|nr:uncharacterized protein K450DRAFT_226287 [Umbelopsis ramanniana AG]KAI8582643.1 hypothetical protein K450DRAFT_226287 [Umbelopsis ramanniana AG]